ncbi:MAG: MarR family transcriptional regulator [Myxococcales bacterium]
MPTPAVSQFIEAWGTMGALWGINRSTARVHAMLLTAEEPLHLDQIAEPLAISRGNVSMSLKELSSWGLVERSNQGGDRRDYFSADRDTWSMFFKIARERKRREFDPALQALRRLLAAQGEVGAQTRVRLADMEKFLSSLDRILAVVLADLDKAKNLLAFFTDLIFPKVK